MQIPILNGIYTDKNSDYRTSYPRNYMPIPKEQGISKGYLRPADGLVKFGEGPGINRGGINWKGVYYRVMGTSLVSISKTGVTKILGSIPGIDTVVFDYSFDRLAIAANESLYYFDGTTVTQVTDEDLGKVLDMAWVDGYFMTTDGEFLVVTELNDPYAVNPLKYGSSEIDPDPVQRILKLRNEIHALNRYTTEVFNNVGGDFFPFQRVDGAQIMKGCIGKRAATIVDDVIVFVGSGRNEPPSVYLAQAGSSVSIATREIDQMLQTYSEDVLSKIDLESRLDKKNQLVYIHLPDRTLVYDLAASKELGEPAWFILTSGLQELSPYRARGFVYCYDKWFCADTVTANHGFLDNSVSTHYGEPISWDFSTQIVYNGSKGVIFHCIELVSLPGRSAVGADTTVWTQFSIDGMTWSQKFPTSSGRSGLRDARIAWFQQGYMDNCRIQKFSGTSGSHLSIARLEVEMEALNV